MGGQKTLPDLTGRFLQGSKAAGNVVEAGLPAITGSFATYSYVQQNSSPSNGAISANYVNDSSPQFYNAKGLTFFNTKVIFDASKSNSIYSASTTVQPPAYTVKYYICGA